MRNAKWPYVAMAAVGLREPASAHREIDQITARP